MKLKNQRRIAAKVLKCSRKRVRFDSAQLQEIKESITKADIRGLVIDGIVKKKKKKGISRHRARKTHMQKVKGRKKGQGRRKGTTNARLADKEQWKARIRKQRAHLKMLKSKGLIDSKKFREFYNKAKGGFFRSERHLKLYIKGNVVRKKE